MSNRTNRTTTLWIFSLLASGTATMSCLRVNQEHCTLRGGDLACSDGFCVAAVGGKSASIADADAQGCVAALPAEADDWVHVKYGLPTATRMSDGGGGEQLDTVEGVIRATLSESSRGFDDSDDCNMRLADMGNLKEIHDARMAKDGKKVSARRFAFTSEEKQAIEALELAIDETVAACSTDGGTTSTTTEGMETSTGGTASGSGSSTTGPIPCTSNMDCIEVGEDSPFCSEDGICVPCGQAPQPADADAACADRDAQHPVCVGDSCVACREGSTSVCDDQLMWCDTQTNSCLACTEHTDQCTSGACELATGECFPATTPIVTVDGDGGADFTSVNAAVASFGPGDYGIVVVHENAGDNPYNGQVLVNQGKIIALLAAPGEAPIIQGTGMMDPGLHIQDAGTVLYADGLEISGHQVREGVIVDGAFAWFDRSQIVTNAGGGILDQNGAELTVRNCFVGGDNNDSIALEVNDSTARVLYSTLGAGTFNAAALACSSPILVEVRNSILVTRGGTPPDEISCPAADISFSATEGMVPGMGNVSVGMFPGATPTDWFVGYPTGNFHLQNDGLTLFADIAQWEAGDPMTDIDGKDRPNVAGSPDYAGADVPMP